MTLYIHRFECPDCGANTHADRAVGCYRCGTEMEVEKRQVGEFEP